jgi:hypothetical protein
MLFTQRTKEEGAVFLIKYIINYLVIIIIYVRDIDCALVDVFLFLVVP